MDSLKNNYGKLILASVNVQTLTIDFALCLSKKFLLEMRILTGV